MHATFLFNDSVGCGVNLRFNLILSPYSPSNCQFFQVKNRRKPTPGQAEQGPAHHYSREFVNLEDIDNGKEFKRQKHCASLSGLHRDGD